jgi:hypothetical protein
MLEGQEPSERAKDRRKQETRPHERRWHDAPIFLVERRQGKLWKYGSFALAVALMVTALLLLR